MIVAAIVDNALRLDERPTPDPGPRDVLVAVRAAGINAADRLQVAGHYPAPPDSVADVPGLELAGVVIAQGSDIQEHWVGQRVTSIVGGGAHATHCLVAAEHLLEIPPSMSDLEAGGFSEAVVTAHDALVTQARVSEGERVLISGASGGVGHLAVQIAALRGAHVTAVTRHTDHHDTLRDLGAAEVIDVTDVRDIDPVDVILELVGAPHLEQALPRLGAGGRAVVIGVGAGRQASLDLRHLMGTRATLTGSTLRWRPREEKYHAIEAVRRDLRTHWMNGDLRVRVADARPFEEITRAYDDFARPGKFGKVVLEMAS